MEGWTWMETVTLTSWSAPWMTALLCSGEKHFTEFFVCFNFFFLFKVHPISFIMYYVIFQGSSGCSLNHRLHCGAKDCGPKPVSCKHSLVSRLLSLNQPYFLLRSGNQVQLLSSLFGSITATLCMSFTLSNGNKDFKKDISECSLFSSVTVRQSCDLSISNGFEFQSAVLDSVHRH